MTAVLVDRWMGAKSMDKIVEV